MIKLYREVKMGKKDIFKYERYGINPYTRREYEPVKIGEEEALIFNKSIYISKDCISYIYKEDIEGEQVSCICDKLGNKFYGKLPLTEYIAEKGNLSINDCKRLMEGEYDGE